MYCYQEKNPSIVPSATLKVAVKFWENREDWAEWADAIFLPPDVPVSPGSIIRLIPGKKQRSSSSCPTRMCPTACKELDGVTWGTLPSEGPDSFFCTVPPEFSSEQPHMVQTVEQGSVLLPLLVSASPSEITYRWTFLGEVLLAGGSHNVQMLPSENTRTRLGIKEGMESVQGLKRVDTASSLSSPWSLFYFITIIMSWFL